MRTLPHFFERNRDWARRITTDNPEFFETLSRQQSPEHLWIGCSDSRVPANQIVGLLPGEVFVHRNVSNLVVHTDLNCLSVMQYAVDVLKVKHVIVCGHYGCGGIEAASRGLRLGLVDNWLRHVRDVQERHRAQLAAIGDDALRRDRLCELNVIEQVRNVCETMIVREAWERGQAVNVHGWCYALKDGLLRDLGTCITSPEKADSLIAAALDVRARE